MNLKLSLGRCYLRVADPGKPVSLSTIFLLRRLSAGTDSLSPRNIGGSSRGLRHPILSQVLEHDEFGVWSLCTQTLNFIEREIQSRRPSVILEFGSGISTLCLATFMHDLFGDSERIYVCSVEQNPSVLESTSSRLSKLKLDRYVRLVNAPLVPQRILGRDLRCYAVSEKDMEEIRRLRPDFVIVDGPAAEAGARFGPLPIVREAISPDAHVFLDDALRDGELGTARDWVQLLGLKADGILPTRKGLLIGHLNRGSN